MKTLYHVLRSNFKYLFALLISLQLPAHSFASPADGDLVIFVSCVEDLGDGTFMAYFGYENTTSKTLTVQAKKSYIAYNYTRDEKYVINTFEPGVHEKVFSQLFNDDDWVRWTVKVSGSSDVIARADVNSERCVVETLPIIPYYAPPEGGKVYVKIGAELTSLFETYIFDPAGFTGVSDNIYQLEGTRVLIEVVAMDGQYTDMMNALGLLGFNVVTQEPSLQRATGTVEIADLATLNAMIYLNYARPVYPGIGNFEVDPTGLVNSQGDKAMRSDFARLGYDIDGSGVKIGVLSNSYNTLGNASVDVGNGDLPGATNPNGYLSNVQVLQDVPSSYGTLSDEGRAMLQIVHDIAPGAELAFRTGYLGEQDMALGIQQLAAAGADVIVDDITYITEPFFRDGVISQAIDQVVSDSVVFFSSAGNFGEASYMADFVSAPAPGTVPGVAHDFGGGDVLQAVELPEGTYTLVLQWDDGSHPEMATTSVDLDLYLTNDEASVLLGFNRENIGGFPIEVIPFSVEGATVVTNIVVSKAAGPDVDVKFKYIMFRGGSLFNMLEHVQGTSTIVGHPNAAGAIAVGAVRYDKNPVYSPLTYTEPVIMSFSSVGGTPVNEVVRSKPDITAPNGVNTTVDLGNGDWDDPADPDTDYPNFFGTSAASPHAAAVAALILEARQKFDPGHPLGPNGIRSLMRSTAMDMDIPGVDFISGAGFLRADRAILTFANPYPLVENVIPDGGEPMPSESLDPLSFTVNGDYFIDDTQILFRGDTLNAGVMLEDDQTISVDHPGFLGNPLVQAFTPAISVSGLDGGVSDSVYFTDLIKQTVVISANSAVKKYGEPVPEYSAEIVLITNDEDTLSLSEAVSGTLMSQAEANRLSGLSFTVPATDTSNAGEYLIQPALSPVYNAENPQTELDYAISEKYKLVYENSSLVVEKLALKITPVNVNMTYGQQLPAEGFDFLYEITDSSVVVEDLGLVLAEVESEHTEALTNEISLVRGVALVNGIPMLRGTALVNGVKLLRGTALVNGVEVLVEVIGVDTTVYVDGEAVTNGGSLARGVALVNDLPFVNMLDIRRGVALVNGNEITFDDGFMTELNGEALTSAIPAVRGVALVNGGPSGRGIALVNGVEVIFEDGITTIGGVPVPSEGIVEMNGIPAVRGVALVNSGNILRGTALVNGIEFAIENGIPNIRGVALVNGIPTLRGVALVNGIPMFRGTALVNNLEVLVDEGEVTQVLENGSEILNGTALVNGVGFIRGTALVNGGALGRGTALVNGVALVNGNDYSDDVVNLENMNFLASGTALVNGSFPTVRGTALVNGIEGFEGESLLDAAGTVQPDGSIIYPMVNVGPRGLALVNGFNFVRGTALVNGSPFIRGTALVNGSSINENSNTGTIMVFDATDTIAAQLDTIGFSPISFITGTTAGKHWIVPGTFLSNNFEISYGLGELNIEEAIVNVTADDQSKTYGDPDPELSSQKSDLLGTDQWMGALSREEGEDVGYYHILQGTLDAGDNYIVNFTPDSLNILQASLSISATATDKVYDGNTLAQVVLSATTVAGDVLDYSYSSANFDDKNVGDNKTVTILGITLSGDNAGNYSANETTEAAARITPAGVTVTANPQTKTYGDSDPVLTYEATALIGSDAWEGFLERTEGENAGVYPIALGTLSAGNNYAITYNPDNLIIEPAALTISATASDKDYDGSQLAAVAFTDDRLSDDIFDISYTSALFADANAEPNKTVTVLGLEIQGADAGNYTANESALATASIRQAAITVTANPQTKTYGDSDPVLTYEATALIGSDAWEGFLERTEGENAGVYPIALGTLSAGDNYAITYVPANLVIEPAALTISATASDKDYDGSQLAMVAFTDDHLGGDIFDINYTSALFADANAGPDKTVTVLGLEIQGADAGNYTANEIALATATIRQAEVTVTANPQTKTYGDADPGLTYVADALIGSDGWTGQLDRAEGEDVSTYQILLGTLSAGNNYNITYVPADLVISRATLTVSATASNKEYDRNRMASVMFTDDRVSGDFLDINYTSALFADENVGEYKNVSVEGISISGDDALNYTLANTQALAQATITKKDVYVSPVEEAVYIDEEDPLPLFAFIYNGWIAGDAGNEGYTVLREDGAAYDASSSTSAGTYTVTPVPLNDNYSYTLESGILYVNPAGPGTRAVKPILNCIEKVSKNGEPDLYVANFTYENRNSVTVHIPLGPDNLFIGSGIDWENAPPEIPTAFIPGGGSFQVFFDGSELSWSVASRDQQQKVRNAANASSSSTKCKGNGNGNGKKAATVSADLEEDFTGTAVLKAFPNPVVNMVTIELAGIEGYQMVQIFDLAGKSHPVTPLVTRSDRLEIDMTRLSSGQYVIRIILEDRSEIVHIIKQ